MTHHRPAHVRLPIPNGIWLAAALTALAIAVFPAASRAQGYPCGGGPGPGEVQIGTTGGSHGIGLIPVCAPAPSGPGTPGSGGGGSGSSGSSRYEPETAVNNYVAVAGHLGIAEVWATLGQYRLEAAEAVVLDACNKTMGGGCSVLYSGANVAVVVARDKQGKMRAAAGADAKQTWKELKAVCKSQGASCSLHKVYHAQVRAEPLIAAAMLREDFDREGVFKEYDFPPNSTVPVPKRGVPDAGVGVGPPIDVMGKLPDIPGIRKVHYSAQGSWLLRTGDKKGKGCSLTYLRDDQRVLFVGPTQTDPRGALMLSSKAVPPTREARETTVTMSGDRGDTSVRVFHLPTGVENESVLLMPTDLSATIASLSDRSPLSIVLDGKRVLDMQIEGGAKARTAMQQCMARR